MFRRTTGKALKVAVVQKISVMNYQGALAIRTNQLLNFKTFFWLQNNRFIVEILENANKIRKEKKLPLTPSSTQITPIMCIYTSFCFFLCVEPPLILIYKKWIFTFFHLNHAYLYQTHTFLYINIVRYSESCSVMSNSLWPHGLYSPWNSLGQNTGVGSLSLLQGIFPTQESNPSLLRPAEPQRKPYSLGTEYFHFKSPNTVACGPVIWINEQRMFIVHLALEEM